MNLYFDCKLAEQYNSQRQVGRILTEHWLAQHGFCPNCGTQPLNRAKHNQPVLDFYCLNCGEQFELKSKQSRSIGNKVPDGAYHTMLDRIQADNNPNFFFMSYRKADYSVRQLMLVPKHFITTDMITPRRKTLPTRPNYLMCDINLSPLPQSGKILLIDNGRITPFEEVCRQWQQHLFLRKQARETKGWLLAVLLCIDKLPKLFTLQQMYAFESKLSLQFPNNRHISAKIRQQLQILRDQKIIEFVGHGVYRKLHDVECIKKGAG